MKPFDARFTRIETFLDSPRTPDFTNLLRVLRREAPSRPTLFEFIVSGRAVRELLTAHLTYDEGDPLVREKRLIDAYRAAGYDFACVRGRSFGFRSDRHKDKDKSSLSLNDGHVITDRASFEAYTWAEPEDADYTWLDALGAYLPDGMKLLVPGPDGVFETVLSLVGHDNLCYLLYDDPGLVREIFDAVGSRYLRYYERCVTHSAVGAMMADDDWGFKTQTFLSADDMRKYVIPWHRRIAAAVHRAGKPVTLHSCGNIEGIIGDVIDDIGHDGWHSFEDAILPVEDAYDKYGERIAILGGIDIDFLCRSDPEEVYRRSCAMLERSRARGGYALGSGNSITDYVPDESYLAMLAAAVFNEW